mmetsp:Transcript_26047/g.46267  ORF Transcript_26047/g.46267 Transcript_26047/m.46267 type:complete len:81 (-) Transcript_26047:171-413(-)
MSRIQTNTTLKNNVSRSVQDDDDDKDDNGEQMSIDDGGSSTCCVSGNNEDDDDADKCDGGGISAGDTELENEEAKQYNAL